MRTRRNRVTPAANFQPRNDPVLEIARAGAKTLVRPMKLALKRLRALVPVATVEQAIKMGSIEHVIDAIAFHRFAELLKEPISIIGDIYESGAHHGTRELSHKLKPKGLRYRAPKLRKAGENIGLASGLAFDRFAQATQDRLAAIIDELVVELGSASRATITAVVLAGVRAGDSAAEIAAVIRDTISLTTTQASAVASYRRALENLDSNALQRALRDAGADSIVADAIASGDFLPGVAVDDLVDAYTENYLDYRAATIARTESLRAGNAGLREGYLQAVDSGALPEAAIKRVWLLDLDEATCQICIGILDANPDGVGLNEDFEGADGDPPVHPNCRCTIQYETDLDMVPDQTVQEEA